MWLQVCRQEGGESQQQQGGTQPSQGPESEAGQQRRPRRSILVSWVANAYMLGILPLELYASFVHPLLDAQDNLPFLPRLVVSVYCALGMCGLYYWLDWPFASLHNQELHAKAA